MSAETVCTYSVKQLYDYLSKQLKKDEQEIAKVLKKNNITGEIFLSLTDAHVRELFPDIMGYRISLQKLIDSHQQQSMVPSTSKKIDQPPPPYNSSCQMVPKAPESLTSTFQQIKIALPTAYNIATPELHVYCQQVEVGPPSVYKLQPQQKFIDEKNKIASYVMNCGQSRTVDQDASHKVLLLVGATGTGKSTLINALANHFLGVTFSDPYRYTIITHKDEGKRSQAHSQTSWIKAYTFPKQPGSRIPYTLTIIDTPGYGDTKGVASDVLFRKQIKNFFESKELGVDHVNAIAFVVKSSDTRLPPSQKYIFTEILTLFGNNVGPNVMIVATHANGTKNKAEDALKEAGIPVHKNLTFLVNNCELLSTENEDSDFVTQRSLHWKISAKAFAEMETALGQMEDRSLWQSIQNLKEREALQAVLEGIGTQIRELTNSIQNMKQVSEEIKKHEREMDENKNFKIKITETVVKKVKIPLGKNLKSFNCQKCETTCHFPCTTGLFRKCQVVTLWGNECSVCAGKCSGDSSHKVESFKFEPRYEEKTKEENSKDFLEKTFKYAHAEKGASISKQCLDKLKADRQKTIISCSMLVRAAKDKIERIREISLNPSPATEEDYINLLIANEENQLNAGWEGRREHLEKLKRASDAVKTIEELTESNMMAKLTELGMDPHVALDY